MIRLVATFGLVFAIAHPARGDQEERAREVSVEQLILDLGDERFPVRINASHELWLRGEEAGEVLRRAAASDDPEVAIRAREVLRKIELGILPDSPPEVVRLVVAYDKASPDERVRIIRSLKQLGAWRQVLKIHELEKDPATLVQIAPEIKGVSVAAARELLAEEEPDLDEARRFLEMGRPEPAQLLSLADFHRMNGTLESELEKAASLQGEAGHLWRYALHAAAGNFLDAAREAEAIDMTLTAARLHLLAGDPIPWLRHAPVPHGEIPPAAIDAYRKAVERLWSGRLPSERFARVLADGVKHDLDDESWHSLTVLYALGLNDEADPLFARLSPVMAYYHFDSTERIDMALKALGLDPRNPDFGAAIDADFRAFLKDPDNSEVEQERLFALAGFLESRGLKKVLLDHYVGPLEQLGRKDEEIFIEALGELFSAYTRFPVATPVFPAVVGFAGEDDGRWRTALSTLFGDADVTHAVWESLDEFQPDLSPGHRLELLASLLGRVPGRAQLAADWWAWMEKKAAGAKELDQKAAYGTMLVLAVMNTDAERFLKLTASVREAGLQLSDVEGDYQFGGFEIMCLAAVDRWDEVAGHWARRAQALPGDPVTQAYLAGSLRRAGKPDEAAKADLKVDRLALGDTNAMRRIGQAYASAGEFDRAKEWWLRAAAEAVDEDGEFHYAALLLYEEAKFGGDWKLAASLGELYLLQQVMMGDTHDTPLPVVRGRIEVETARALARLDEDRERSIETLRRCHGMALSDGSMADYFFPAMRAVGLTKLHDEWFEHTWKAYKRVLERFPDSHNTMNTAAWTASRANRRLDEAEVLVTRALELLPRQAAYLDTLAEVWFARGNREKAIEWSDRAMLREPADDGLLRQHDRFVSGPFPLK
ncbi:tetratricopeptide repeat protein [Haloferula sp. A504]|uniref:tetratricopeptide repeat protein n=1 Tax=Haloferula sp. A504 TaxID=3373601 RepID=UPI0031C85737|nr:hypothetical protein [Verrucomicrobiaceae bacterium E54]